MANLSSLIHELRERVASCSSPNAVGDDHIEARFRTVLPNLLHAYVVPSPSANEREVTAVLKLLSHTAKNFPGVFFHGKAAAVLPIVGRILPFFAETSFRSRHGIILDTLGSLLSLIRVGDRDIYRLFVMDALYVVEDIFQIVSTHSYSSTSQNSRRVLKCYIPSFSQISTTSSMFCELPNCCKPKDCSGLLVDIADESRWQSFATWTIKLISKCLTEGTLYIEGLIGLQCVSTIGSLFCYGNAALHMACFDFMRIFVTITESEVGMTEDFICFILCILGQGEKHASRRNAVYDSSLGSCLNVLYSACEDDVVTSTASELVQVFPVAIRNTESSDLKVAMCSAYIRVAKICAAHLWRPEILLDMLCSTHPCLPLISCIRVAIDILGSDCIGEYVVDDLDVCLLSSHTGGADDLVVGKKRLAEDDNSIYYKRKKAKDNGDVHDANSDVIGKYACSSLCEQAKLYAPVMKESLLSFVTLLKPCDLKEAGLRPEIAVTALSILCNVFCNYPMSSLSINIFQQVLLWMPWICQQVKNDGNLIFDLVLYLEAVRNIFLLQSALPTHIKLLKDDKFLDKERNEASIFPSLADLVSLLKHLWIHSPELVWNHPPWWLKCVSLQIFSLISNQMKDDNNNLEILDFAIHDEAEEVRAEAAISLPVFVFYSRCLLNHAIARIEFLGKDKSDLVRRTISVSLGYLSCLQGYINCIDKSDGISCMILLKSFDERQIHTLDLLLEGFHCSQCDKSDKYGRGHGHRALCMPELYNDDVIEFDLVNIQSLFLQLITSSSSETDLLSYIAIIPRILRHGTPNDLCKTRFQWIDCLNNLLLHKNKAVREAFISEISIFVEENILNCLFVGEDGYHDSKEIKFVENIKHVLTMAEDLHVTGTILDSIGEIMNHVDIRECLFYHLLILLFDQLDSPHLIIRVTATKLIHQSSYFHMKGGFEVILSKFSCIRSELFEYLCARLVTRPQIVKVFAEAVIGTKTEEFLNRIVPVVLPKLVISYNNNDESLVTLCELAKNLNTDVVPLIVNWLPKVLAFVLLRANREELSSALQFYHTQTGSDNKEIFSAALPALLDELVCFNGDDDLSEIETRTSSIPQTIQEVARILTGFDDLSVFLRNHFVGLLNSIDRKMLHSDDPKLQKQALKRIEKLIEMMGSNIKTYVPKIMVLLMHAVGKEILQSEGLAMLNYFIKQLANLSPSSTRYVISQVVAAFIPFLERHQEIPFLHLNEIVEILEKLIIKNQLVLKQHIRELPLLPGIPALSKINTVIEEARGSMSLREQLRDADAGLNHESLNVKYMMACELSKLLNTRREDVTTLIAGEIISDMDIINNLIISLLKGCAEESRTVVGQRLKLVCADCLGSLGAVDPAKFKGITCQRFKIECSDDDLIFELIDKHLARAFRAASNTLIQDSAALAIQELLKFAGCQASLDPIEKSNVKESEQDEMNCRGQRLWDRFSSYVKDIIAPCLTSRFQLPSMSDTASSGPIYHPSMSFRRWIFSWIRKLTVHATGSRANIFIACRGIVRHDMQTAVYLLPYLVLNALCHGTVEARDGITLEILSVLNVAASEDSSIMVHGLLRRQSEVCIQAIFTLLDNLGQWVDDLKQEVALSQSLNATLGKHKAKRAETMPNVDQLLIQCNNVSELLAAIPKVTLAKASFYCHAYARALLYFEQHVRDRSGSFNPAAEISGIFVDEDISFLMEIYSGLDEPDGLSGLANLRRSSSLSDQLLINEKAGNWAEVLTLSEQVLQMDPTSIKSHSGVLNCLLNMCHLQSMLTHVDGLISRVPEHKKTWCMHGVQAAWRLGRWDLMGEYLAGAGADQEGASYCSSENPASFDMDLAKILKAMMEKDQFVVAERIAQSKQALIVPLAAAGMDSYMRAYPFVVKLHMLRELEDFHVLLDDHSFLERSFHLDDLKFSQVMKDWDNRLKLTQPSLWAREPLLAFRRLVFCASNLGHQLGNCWLQYAKLCRSAGHHETAQRAILEAQSSGAPNVHMEKAKLLWSTRRSDCAIAELQQSLLNMPMEILGAAATTSLASFSLVPPNPPVQTVSQPAKESFDIAKTILLYTRWIHHTGQKQKEDVINLYTRVRDLQPKWEKGYFFMAKYCDDLLIDSRKRQEELQAFKVSHSGPVIMTSSSSAGRTFNFSSDEKPWWSHLPDVLLLYAKGLHRGHNNLYQALPRLLTLWFEFGGIYQRDASPNDKELKTVYTRVMSIMRGCLKDLPTYQWLTVLSQLISRICHQNVDVVRIVKHIIISVIQEYPQQALWMMAAVSKSTIAARRDAATEIIQSARKGFKMKSDKGSLFSEFASLIDHLIKLCFHPGQPKARTVNIATEFSSLKRMMPLGVIMPLQQALTVKLPAYDTFLTDTPRQNIFSDMDVATISGIKDEAEILSSLQKPKKVVFLGSDGVYRPFLCKPKDDLRKDARMMEFTAMVNRLLSKFPESRRRKLYIRIFAVIPLTEDCGLVEWVPNTRGFRQILQDIYITSGKFDRQKTHPLIKRIYDQYQGKIPDDEMLKHKILPMFPPVFHKWFISTFSEPAAWFRARIAYAHTAAVWSMVGHIVGLGDRHGENILFDSTTGDCVHVDFSCLFDKGLQLEKPELVPFRLTQNMIDGLGITGYEGVFLKVCEITLSVLRTNRETLMSVLETFIHDPLVEWSKSHKSSGAEVQNPHAQKAMSNIKARLQGVVVGVGAAPSLALAVEGQARRLIAEAVSHKNLGKMYIWWMPWF